MTTLFDWIETAEPPRPVQGPPRPAMITIATAAGLELVDIAEGHGWSDRYAVRCMATGQMTRLDHAATWHDFHGADLALTADQITTVEAWAKGDHTMTDHTKTPEQPEPTLNNRAPDHGRPSALVEQILTAQEAEDFLLGKWAVTPAEVGCHYTADDLKGMRGVHLLSMAHDVAREIDAKWQPTSEPTPEPTCDFDCWDMTTKTRGWLGHLGATELGRGWGFVYYEHPLRGDEAPVLAVRDGSGPAEPVWNTHDFDLPTSDPKEPW